MKVIIIAGGLGTRISEETDDKPKPMVLINGQPILWHLMNIFSLQGFNDFVISTGYKSEVIEKWVSKNKILDSNFEKMYINLYDKKMPSIAKRIANKYNSRAALHYIIINDEMIKHHKSGKGSKLRAAAPVGLTASEAVKEKEDKS